MVTVHHEFKFSLTAFRVLLKPIFLCHNDLQVQVCL